MYYDFLNHNLKHGSRILGNFTIKDYLDTIDDRAFNFEEVLPVVRISLLGHQPQV